ncbi:MAG: hypothetical protein AAFU71_18225 [Cyanobacteria bacterium J06632_22]
MPSPFSTLEEFNAAIDGPTGGAIYTFADRPAINAIALLVSVGIFLWFMVKTYATAHQEMSTMDKSINNLSSFIVAGLLSLVAVDQLQQPPVREQAHRRTSRTSLVSTAKRAPMALLGMVGLGLPARRRRRYRRIGSPKR